MAIEHIAIEDIVNFVAIDPKLATAGQPTEAQLSSLRDGGFRVVVNLGLMDPRYCLADEAGSVAALGMTYHPVPVDFQQPTLADYERFCEVMAGCEGQRTLVHCAMNYRVSCFVALLHEQRRGWSREQADAHIARLWQPNAAWSAFVQSVRQTWGAAP